MQPTVSPTSQVILTDDSAPISAKFFHAVHLLGAEALTFELDGETVILEVEKAAGRRMGGISRAKLLFGFGAYGSDVFYKDLPAFNEFANYASTDTPPEPGMFEPANVVECAVAVAELRLINNELDGKMQDDDLQFSEDIRKYWGAVLTTEGIYQAFPPLGDAIIMADLPTDDPMVYAAIDGTARAVRNAIQNEVRASLHRSIEMISQLRGEDNKPIVTHEEMGELLMALTS